LGVPDAQASELIGQPSTSGRPPQFALTTEQAERLELLRQMDQIDTALDVLLAEKRHGR
jgi:hypothetical protein